MRRSGNITRKEAAARLGVSQSTLRRREKRGIVPYLLEGKVHVFDPAVILGLAADPKCMAKTANAKDGAEAASVYTMLDGGASAAAIVKDLQIPPARVETLRIQWARLRGGIFLGPEHLAKINNLTLLLEHMPLVTSDQLVIALEDAFGALGMCRQCHTEIPDVCARCAVRAADSKKMRRRAEAKTRVARLWEEARR
jgi:transcriptional regulator with XRE-family HTH domain